LAKTEFITALYPEATMPRTTGLTRMVQRVQKFIPEGADVRLRKQGEEWGPWKKQADAVEKIKNIVTKLGVGPKLIIQRKPDGEQLSIREVTRTPDLGAHPKIEEGHGMVWSKFDVRSGGLYVCRRIEGSSQVSKHGYQSSSWKGAAEDIFVNKGGMPELTDVARFIVSNAKQLDAATVIVNTSIWTPSQGWRVYGGIRHYHVHWDVPGGSACM
jgi:hypothetical protein